MKVEASLARKMAAPTSSSVLPNRAMGVRMRSFFASVALIEELLVEGGAEDSRGDGVDGDAMGAPLHGERLG